MGTESQEGGCLLASGFWLLASGFWLLEHILERKLKQPRISCRLDLPEIGIVQGSDGIARIHVIRQIESFGSELHALSFPNRKRSRQSHIDLNQTWTENVVCAHRRIGTLIRRLERVRIEILIDGFVRRIWILEDLQSTLISLSRQGDIDAVGHCQIWSAAQPDDARNLPVTG
jgi:hypothetical protein